MKAVGTSSTIHAHIYMSCIGRETNPGLLCDRRALYHRATDADLLNLFNLAYLITILSLFLSAQLLDSTVTSPSGPSVLSHGACFALGEIGRSGSLPCPPDNKLKLVEGLIKAVQTTKYPIKVLRND